MTYVCAKDINWHVFFLFCVCVRDNLLPFGMCVLVDTTTMVCHITCVWHVVFLMHFAWRGRLSFTNPICKMVRNGPNADDSYFMDILGRRRGAKNKLIKEVFDTFSILTPRNTFVVLFSSVWHFLTITFLHTHACVFICHLHFLMLSRLK